MAGMRKAVVGTLKSGVKRAVGKLASNKTVGKVASRAVGSKAAGKAVNGGVRAAGIVKAGKASAGKVLTNAKNVVKSKATTLSGSRVKKAVNNTESYRELARTQTARKKVAGVAAGAAAVSGAAYAKSKSGKPKSIVAKAKSKIQAGYKMVYGKLKRVKAGR